MKHIICISFFALLMIGCDNAPRPPIQMSDFINDVPVKKLGKRLINLPYGLNALEPMEEGANEILLLFMEEAVKAMSGYIPSKKLIQKRSRCIFIAGLIMGVFKALPKH